MRTKSNLKLTLSALLVWVLASSITSAQANTPAEQRYVATMTREISQIGGTLVNFSDLIKHPRVGQRQWTDDIAVCCVQMRMFPGEVRKIPVPKRYMAAHRHLMAALQGYSYIGYHFPHDIDAKDNKDGRLCAEKMGQADEEINRCGETLKAEGAF